MLCAFYFEKMRILVLFRFLCFFIFSACGALLYSVWRVLAPLGVFWAAQRGNFRGTEENTIPSGFASRRAPRFAKMDESLRRRAHF